jgi:hypothetical protein
MEQRVKAFLPRQLRIPKNITNQLLGPEGENLICQRGSRTSDFTRIRVDTRSAQYSVLRNWHMQGHSVRKLAAFSSVDMLCHLLLFVNQGDPLVNFGFFPGVQIMNTVLCPPFALAGAIVHEMSSIGHHMAQLQAQDFQGAVPNFPPVGVLIAAPIQNINFHHSTVALHSLIDVIQHPPPHYPTLLGLASGSYIGSLAIFYANNVVVEVQVFKP